jgi:hypothetical protein
MRAESLALIYLNWKWSQQAKEGKVRLLDVLSRLGDRPPLFEFDCDDDAEAASWLTAECERTRLPLHGGGHGTLLVTSLGAVIGWIEKVHLYESDALRLCLIDILANKPLQPIAEKRDG